MGDYICPLLAIAILISSAMSVGNLQSTLRSVLSQKIKKLSKMYLRCSLSNPNINGAPHINTIFLYYIGGYGVGLTRRNQRCHLQFPRCGVSRWTILTAIVFAMWMQMASQASARISPLDSACRPVHHDATLLIPVPPEVAITSVQDMNDDREVVCCGD